jgi:periplasmic mercuric ion binding protein
MNGDYTMTRIAAAFVALLFSSSAFAAERTVTLAVQNMFCADCPFVVRRSLETVPGVVNAMVSFKDKTAVVTYDDAKVDIKRLTDATTNAGYPSAPKL